MEILKYGHPLLRLKAQDIKNIDDQVVTLAKDMFADMEQNNGIGLAAPQVGVSSQLFVARIPGEPGEELILLNPRIVESSGEWEYEEGCLSVPGISGVCIRPKDIVVEGTTLDGKPFRKHYTDLAARVIQHEIDHLNGVLFVDRLNAAKRAIIQSKLKKMAKNNTAR